MFDFSDVQSKHTHREFLTKERQQRTVASLHAILKPFLLRRVKDDVETNLPKKREYILYAPLTPEQRDLYRKIKENDIRSYLEEKALERLGDKLENHRVGSVKGKKRKAESGTSTPNKSAKSSRGSTPASSIRSGRRGRGRKSYEEVSDRQWFKQLEEDSESESVDSEEEAEKEKEETLAQARKMTLHEYGYSADQIQARKYLRRSFRTQSCNSVLRATLLITSRGPGALMTQTKRS